ncbi:hypothetical protein QAD02_017159 [Eretmocerus hayati]|uniref:Uncharacterized protein n=1 Tax=Eretmocerus hayati TaxID=131215 RepID=A0ACC2PFZ2_9HYME|nr:hypothetical protein QAD02_017159 [Eretmocerus hayati]
MGHSESEVTSGEKSASDDEETQCSDGEANPLPFPSQLRLWALRNRIHHAQLSELLVLLHSKFPELPKSAKTFLQNKSSPIYQVEKCMPGDESDKSEFVYFGIEEYLKKSVNPNLHLEEMIIFLKFFVDGIPLFKSSSIEFWPILGQVFCESHDVYKPFNIATWCGEGKPKSVEFFFSKFIKELNHLFKNGIEIEGKKFSVKCKCFICDRPARSFVKQTQGHAGFYACERCQLAAFRLVGTTVFPTERGEMRTDKSFRQKSHLEHHNLISPIEDLEPWVDMIKIFIIESMHVGPLGTMKRLLTKMWIGGEKKISEMNALKLSVRLTNLSHQIPWEFQRKTRSLSTITHWNANEHALFLKYCGPMVLDGLLDNHLFEHFLLLHTSFRILSCPRLHKTHLSFARSYLESFVKLTRLPNYYSQKMSTINMHDLLHIPDDGEDMNCDITKYTAFPFENDLGVMKRDLRSGNKPLAQLCRRKAEKDLLIERPAIPPLYCILKTANRKGGGKVITKFKCKGYEIGLSYPNNIVLLENGSFMRVKEISEEGDGSKRNFFMKGTGFTKKSPAFSYPPNAFGVLNIFVVEENPAACLIKWSVKDIKSKCCVFQIYELDESNKKMFAVPMLYI